MTTTYYNEKSVRLLTPMWRSLSSLSDETRTRESLLHQKLKLQRSNLNPPRLRNSLVEHKILLLKKHHRHRVQALELVVTGNFQILRVPLLLRLGVPILMDVTTPDKTAERLIVVLEPVVKPTAVVTIRSLYVVGTGMGFVTKAGHAGKGMGQDVKVTDVKVLVAPVRFVMAHLIHAPVMGLKRLSCVVTIVTTTQPTTSVKNVFMQEREVLGGDLIGMLLMFHAPLWTHVVGGVVGVDTQVRKTNQVLFITTEPATGVVVVFIPPIGIVPQTTADISLLVVTATQAIHRHCSVVVTQFTQLLVTLSLLERIPALAKQLVTILAHSVRSIVVSQVSVVESPRWMLVGQHQQDIKFLRVICVRSKKG